MRNSSLGLLIGTLIAAAPARGQYREIAVTNGGSISGEVHMLGEVPSLPPLPVFKQQETCGSTVKDERLVVGPNGALQNAIVYLSDIKAGKALHLEQPVKLDNKGCIFVPHAMTATLGQTLEIHNSDPFPHDAQAWLGSKTLFNVGVVKGQSAYQPLLDAGLIYINCNLRHTWMHSHLYVAEHPYHAVTDAQGRFKLEDVPPGMWTLRVWHELVGSTDEQVRLQPGENRTLTVMLKSVAVGDGQ